tara:strand:- start:786 stop:1007 length:222 start_codon:yes stop_codon:yes gene_type:complete
MSNSKLPVLKISDIIWNQDSSGKSLPKEIVVKWTSTDYSDSEIILWLGQQYNCSILDFTIVKSDYWKAESEGG